MLVSYRISPINNKTNKPTTTTSTHIKLSVSVS